MLNFDHKYAIHRADNKPFTPTDIMVGMSIFTPANYPISSMRKEGDVVYFSSITEMTDDHQKFLESFGFEVDKKN